MSPFDYIRRRLTKIADVVLSVDGAYPTWSYSDLCMLLDEVEKEWSKEECHEDGDTVNRQAAIDALRKLSREDGYIDMPHEYVTDAVRALPSAQSERKMCNLCKYYEGVHRVQGHAPCSFWRIGGVMYDDYCSRWEKCDE